MVCLRSRSFRKLKWTRNKRRRMRRGREGWWNERVVSLSIERACKRSKVFYCEIEMDIIDFIVAIPLSRETQRFMELKIIKNTIHEIIMNDV